MQKIDAIAMSAGNADEVSIAGLVDRYHTLIFRQCLRLLGHRQDAEDATQETFSRIFKSLHLWDSSRPIEPWLVAIAGNRCRSFLATRRQHRELQPAMEPCVDRENQFRAADHLREEISLAMAAMPANHRQAFELFHEQQCSYEEIGRQMKCPTGTAKTWVHRARTRIISQLRAREVIASSQPTSADATTSLEVR